MAQRSALLDERVPVGPSSLMSDDELDALALTFIEAGELVSDAGFDFVDIKHCHGYLLHELLGAHSRDGRFGGSFEGRTRFLRLVVEELRRRVYERWQVPQELAGGRVTLRDDAELASVRDAITRTPPGPGARALVEGSRAQQAKRSER